MARAGLETKQLTNLVSRAHLVNFSSEFVLHMHVNGQMITNKPQSGTGSFISSKKEYKTLRLNIIIINFFPSCIIFCIQHQLQHVLPLQKRRKRIKFWYEKLIIKVVCVVLKWSVYKIPIAATKIVVFFTLLMTVLFIMIPETKWVNSSS